MISGPDQVVGIDPRRISLFGDKKDKRMENCESQGDHYYKQDGNVVLGRQKIWSKKGDVLAVRNKPLTSLVFPLNPPWVWQPQSQL
nr:3520_t:CDS:2 [Entrophospora candida]